MTTDATGSDIQELPAGLTRLSRRCQIVMISAWKHQKDTSCEMTPIAAIMVFPRLLSGAAARSPVFQHPAEVETFTRRFANFFASDGVE